MSQPRERGLALLFVLVLGLAGCGINLDVSVRNQSDRSLRVEVIDEFSSDRVVCMTVDVVSSSEFSYRLRDGRRADRKLVTLASWDPAGGIEPLEVEVAGFWGRGPTLIVADVHAGRVIRVEGR